MRDDEWGFFVDLEVDYENITKKIIQPIKTIHSDSRKKVNYISTIYEDDYWYERDDEYEGEYEIKTHKQEANKKQNKKENEKEKKYKQIETTTAVIIYCLFCASFISWSLTMV